MSLKNIFLRWKKNQRDMDKCKRGMNMSKKKFTPKLMSALLYTAIALWLFQYFGNNISTFEIIIACFVFLLIVTDWEYLAEREKQKRLAKVRSLDMQVEFAPVDFISCIAAGYSDAKLEEVITSIESNVDDGSVNYQNNIDQIAQYKAGKLTKE